MADLVFESTARKEEPVKIAGVEYALFEATEKAASEYLDLGVSNLELTEGKVSGMRGGAANSAVLISRCLFLVEKNDDDERVAIKSVHIDTIRGWPYRITKPIFDKAVKLSNLEPKEEKEDLLKQQAEIAEKLAKIEEEESDPAKNDESDTTTNSE